MQINNYNVYHEYDVIDVPCNIVKKLAFILETVTYAIEYR